MDALEGISGLIYRIQDSWVVLLFASGKGIRNESFEKVTKN